MIHVVKKSGSEKIGPISATRTNAIKTCPSTCALLQDGTCYDMLGNQGIHRDRVDRGEYETLTPDQFLASMDQLTRIWRWCTGGDLPSHDMNTDRIDRRFLTRMVKGIESNGQTAIIYTHKPVITGTRGALARDASHNRAAIRQAIKSAPSVAVNVSCESPEEVDQAMAHGFPCTVTLPLGSPAKFTTPAGNKVKVCPQQLAKGKAKITCGETCRSRNGIPICADPTRDYAVGFIAHGSRKSKLTQRILGQ